MPGDDWNDRRRDAARLVYEGVVAIDEALAPATLNKETVMIRAQAKLQNALLLLYDPRIDGKLGSSY